MDQLRQLPPWQIISGSAAILLVFLIGGYFLVTFLTSTPAPEQTTSQVPADLDSPQNQKVIEQLDTFEDAGSLPIQTDPLRTPDPNSPSSVNPFQ